MTRGGGTSRGSGAALGGERGAEPARPVARRSEGAEAEPALAQASPALPAAVPVAASADKMATARRVAAALEQRRPATGAAEREAPAATAADRPTRAAEPSPVAPVPAPTQAGNASSGVDPAFKEAFLEEIRRVKLMFHRTVVAQAARIDVEPGAVVFAFGRPQRGLRTTLEQNRGELEAIAERVAGRKLAVRAIEMEAQGASPAPAIGDDPGKATLLARAAAEPAVQNMLDVFRAEIRDVEEIED